MFVCASGPPNAEDGTAQNRPIGMAVGRHYGSGSAELFSVPIVGSGPLDVTLDRTKGKGRPNLFFVGGDGHLKELKGTEAGRTPLWRDIGPVPVRLPEEEGGYGFVPVPAEADREGGAVAAAAAAAAKKKKDTSAADAVPVIVDSQVPELNSRDAPGCSLPACVLISHMPPCSRRTENHHLNRASAFAVVAPAAQVLRMHSVFVVARDGLLHKYNSVSGVWHSSEAPGAKLALVPGAAVRAPDGPAGSLFLVTQDGAMVERSWEWREEDSLPGRWKWVAHGKPAADVTLASAPPTHSSRPHVL